ncbi:peptidase M23B [Calothrix sp. NIES-4071]|nr:peptidase M23B [Calothrix sp. NIES-4071]BAZ63731.1 peptidase M23B [Calothrix sp. NIES-4105]
MSRRLQKTLKTGAILFLLGLSLAVSMILFPNQEVVLARQLASSWQGASFPVENFQAYTSPFGYRPSATGGGGWEFHSGLDIAAPRGSYIRNWWTGVVTKVEDRGACGTHIVIQSGQWQHTYCHMEGNLETANGVRYMVDRAGGIQIAQGMQISAGTRIGRVGMSGRTTGPHLHWGLKFNGNHVDPAFVLRSMFAQQPANLRQARQGSSFINQQQTQIKIQESKFIRDSGY